MDVKAYLVERGIAFTEFTHIPVATVAEAKAIRHTLPIKGMHCKNLFLKERKSRRFYLVVMPEEKELDIKELGNRLGDKLKFANAEDLQKLLGLEPGGVSIFGLINDTEHVVKLLLEKEVYDAPFVTFHPNVNTSTLELSRKDFHLFLEGLENAQERI